MNSIFLVEESTNEPKPSNEGVDSAKSKKIMAPPFSIATRTTSSIQKDGKVFVALIVFAHSTVEDSG